MMIAKQVFFDGRVQGVGFRYTVKELARGFEVTGWVKNLADGRVEMLAVGDEGEVADFLREILEESAMARNITMHEVFVVDVPEGLRGFQIVR